MRRVRSWEVCTTTIGWEEIRFWIALCLVVAACAKYMFGDKLKATSLHELSGGVSQAMWSFQSWLEGHTMNSAPASAKGAGYTVEEVAKHTTKGDVWVVLHCRVLHVSNFLSQHLGGELAIITFAG